MENKQKKIEETIQIIVNGNNGRIDKFLVTELNDLSRSKIQLLIQDEMVLVNGEKTQANYKVQEKDEVTVYIPEPEPVDIVAEDLPLEIIYEDEDLVVINKKQGMVVHPSAGHNNGTLVNALLYHIEDLSGINGEIRPGIVHRLDKDTSGALVVAKNDDAHIGLSEQLQDRSMGRKYWALVHGILPHNHGTIDAPIGRDPKNRQQYSVITNGKDSISHFKVLERFKEYSLVEVSLETGRTHQIRVHMKYIDFPVAGDEIYGPKKTLVGEGQFLHARVLEFKHPRTGEIMRFEAEIPDHFSAVLDELRNQKG